MYVIEFVSEKSWKMIPEKNKDPSKQVYTFTCHQIGFEHLNGIVYIIGLMEVFSVCLQLNRAEFENMDDESRVQYEGFRPGMYVRVEIPDVPCEFVTNFDPHYPIILGSLGASEGNIGYLQVSLIIWLPTLM